METIQYLPSHEDFKKFWSNSPTKATSPAKPPTGFPAHLDSPSSWDRSLILSKQSQWIFQLTESDIEQIETALQKLDESHVGYPSISSETFALPSELCKQLRKISDELYKGCGIALLKGLDPSRYTQEQNVKLFAGIASHIAAHRGFLDWDRQKVLSHVIDVTGPSSKARWKTPGFTNSPLTFHTDSCEILALYALNVAEDRGRTLVSSSHQLYNELAANYPDVLQTLADDWVIDTFQDYLKHPPKNGPCLHRGDYGNGPVIRYSRFPMTGFEDKRRNAALPSPTRAQVEALNTVQFLAEKNSVPLPMEKGDLIFINDMAILHGREGYIDAESTAAKRHLLKMYLRDPLQKTNIPGSLKEEWERVYGPNGKDGQVTEMWCPDLYPDLDEHWMKNG
ncbi:Clavaminate synthase-like protein [Annulohypoxylon moriforme]|nr:Clavaminate synthase-like protein [Annulohypoxylon moriforme]